MLSLPLNVFESAGMQFKKMVHSRAVVFPTHQLSGTSGTILRYLYLIISTSYFSSTHRDILEPNFVTLWDFKVAF